MPKATGLLSARKYVTTGADPRGVVQGGQDPSMWTHPLFKMAGFAPVQ